MLCYLTCIKTSLVQHGCRVNTSGAGVKLHTLLAHLRPTYIAPDQNDLALFLDLSLTATLDPESNESSQPSCTDHAAKRSLIVGKRLRDQS